MTTQAADTSVRSAIDGLWQTPGLRANFLSAPFSEIGIASGGNNCRENQANNYHSAIASRRGNAKHRTPNEQR